MCAAHVVLVRRVKSEMLRIICWLTKHGGGICHLHVIIKYQQKSWNACLTNWIDSLNGSRVVSPVSRFARELFRPESFCPYLVGSFALVFYSSTKAWARPSLEILTVAWTVTACRRPTEKLHEMHNSDITRDSLTIRRFQRWMMRCGLKSIYIHYGRHIKAFFKTKISCA